MLIMPAPENSVCCVFDFKWAGLEITFLFFLFTVLYITPIQAPKHAETEFNSLALKTKYTAFL